jgi:hypothetical protein
MKRPLLHLTCAALLTSLAGAQSFVETFEAGSNQGGWTWNIPCESILGSGGNPGAYLDQACLDTFAAQPRTTDPNSVFCGDWRSRGVSHLGVDLITTHVNFPFERELHLMLSNGSETVFVGHGEPNGVPQIAEGWKSLDFVIDSQSATLPDGWEIFIGTGNDDADWNAVIGNVTEVRFFYGYPFDLFIFDQWFTGLDNVRITEGFGAEYCTSNPNSTGAPGVLGVSGSAAAADDLLYLNAFQLPPDQFGYFLASQTQGFVAGPGGSQGNLCLGGQIKRFAAQIDSTGPEGRLTIPVDTAAVPILAGESWNFQAWHRDLNPGPTSNFTGAVSATFQ